MKKGFTLLELMVVIGMIAIMMAAMTVSIAKARTRAKIAKAMQETHEMTNAILAYEQYAKGRSLDKAETSGSWKNCDEDSMAMILGGETGESGESIPVLYNATIQSGELRDPWGTCYQYMVEKTEELGSSIRAAKTAAFLPNYNRLNDKERAE